MLFGIIGFLLFVRLTCDESLPPRVEPLEVYSVDLQIITPYPDQIRRDTGQVEGGKGNLGFNVSVKNVFDETLTDTVQYRFGQIEIWWKHNPDVMKTIPLTIRDEIETNEIGFWGDIIFDPGDSVYLALVWPFIMDDDSLKMWNHLTRIVTSDGIEYPPMDFEAVSYTHLTLPTN